MSATLPVPVANSDCMQNAVSFSRRLGCELRRANREPTLAAAIRGLVAGPLCVMVWTCIILMLFTHSQFVGRVVVFA